MEEGGRRRGVGGGGGKEEHAHCLLQRATKQTLRVWLAFDLIESQKEKECVRVRARARARARERERERECVEHSCRHLLCRVLYWERETE